MNLIFSDFRKIFSFPSSTLPPLPNLLLPKNIYPTCPFISHTLTLLPQTTHPNPKSDPPFPPPFPHPPIKKQSMLFIPFFKCMVIIAPTNCDLSSIFCTTAQAVPFKDTLVPLYVLFYYLFPLHMYRPLYKDNLQCYINPYCLYTYMNIFKTIYQTSDFMSTHGINIVILLQLALMVDLLLNICTNCI